MNRLKLFALAALAAPTLAQACVIDCASSAPPPWTPEDGELVRVVALAASPRFPGAALVVLVTSLDRPGVVGVLGLLCAGVWQPDEGCNPADLLPGEQLFVSPDPHGGVVVACEADRPDGSRCKAAGWWR